MKIFILSFLYVALAGANTTMNPNETPAVDDKTGAPTPELEQINTSPNPVPAHNESEEFRGSTIQKQDTRKQQSKKREKIIDGSPLNESNGKYRKGL